MRCPPDFFFNRSVGGENPLVYGYIIFFSFAQGMYACNTALAGSLVVVFWKSSKS